MKYGKRNFKGTQPSWRDGIIFSWCLKALMSAVFLKETGSSFQSDSHTSLIYRHQRVILTKCLCYGSNLISIPLSTSPKRQRKLRTSLGLNNLTWNQIWSVTSTLQRCLYYGGRDCMKFDIFWIKRTVHRFSLLFQFRGCYLARRVNCQ